jgi:hypothetical protein
LIAPVREASALISAKIVARGVPSLPSSPVAAATSRQRELMRQE